MISKIRKFAIYAIIGFVVINAFLILITNVSTTVSKSDESIFKSILAIEKPKQQLSYEEEIALIKSVQLLILKEVPLGDPIPEYHSREPEDILRHRSGLCYDRSRTYDKVFTWLGFKTRHVYILFDKHPADAESKPYWRAIVTRGAASHAVTEVKTSKGWILVDSNSPWISLAKNGEPVGADYIPGRAKDFESIPEYFERPYLAIRGLYSRRGHLYPPYLPYPQLNWPDFLSWSLGIE